MHRERRVGRRRAAAREEKVAKEQKEKEGKDEKEAFSLFSFLLFSSSLVMRHKEYNIKINNSDRNMKKTT